jgi:3-methyladenine DNA glycosylase AlkD
LSSAWHEERLLALLVLVEQYRLGDDDQRNAIHSLYLKNTRHVNNWDLVDSSAPQLVGAHLRPRSRTLLDRLAKSQDVWERRIAMLATLHYIKQGQFRDARRIATLLVADEHDLIQKAVGWMLREIANRDCGITEQFLDAHAHHMPRTMLRYAIEQFPPALRKKYMTARNTGNTGHPRPVERRKDV